MEASPWVRSELFMRGVGRCKSGWRSLGSREPETDSPDRVLESCFSWPMSAPFFLRLKFEWELEVVGSGMRANNRSLFDPRKREPATFDLPIGLPCFGNHASWPRRQARSLCYFTPPSGRSFPPARHLILRKTM